MEKELKLINLNTKLHTLVILKGEYYYKSTNKMLKK
jgi:hypothetical protein